MQTRLEKTQMIDLEELVREGVISDEIAERIQLYYASKKSVRSSKLLIAFAILGSLLIGLGILLILAHNWDTFSRSAKTIIAFVPLLFGQVLSGYALWHKSHHHFWREGTGVFFALSIGVTLSVVSQIYHISGSMAGFLLTWLLLALPIIYIMNSAMVSLLYIGGITWFACDAGYWNPTSLSPHLYWILLLCGMPYYFYLIRKNNQSNFTFFHHWLVPLSLTCILGITAEHNEAFMFLAYFLLFNFFTLVGGTKNLKANSWLKNGYLSVGTVGIIVMGLILSFSWFWVDLITKPFNLGAPEVLLSLGLLLMNLVLLIRKTRQEPWLQIDLVQWSVIIFTLIFIVGFFWQWPGQIGANLLIFILGIAFLRQGAQQANLGTLNLGLLTIAVLIACRFFDGDWSFVLRGVVFVLLGAGFILANYFMIKKQRLHE